MIADLIDKAYGLTQFAGKQFGFLDRRDGTVVEERTPEGLCAVFLSDDSGWKPFRVTLPEGSELHQAATAITTRSGMWRTPLTVEEARAFFDARCRDPQATWVQEGPVWRRPIRDASGSRVEVRVGGRGGGATIVLQQRRRRAGLRKSMEATLRKAGDTRS